MARLAGVQQSWWGRQSLNTQWGWQWRGSFYTILLGLLTTQWQTSMDAVGAPRERNGCRGSSLQFLWERNGNNNTQCKRGTSTVDTPWGRGRDASPHPWTPSERRRRLQRSRRDHVRLRCAVTALLRRCRRSHCAATATLYGVPTARMSKRRATARTLSMLKVRAVAWRPRSPHGVQRRCYNGNKCSRFIVLS